MNLNISKALKTTKNVITANSPVLLVGTAIAGVITTGVLAAKGGYKARGIIDDAESTLEDGETLPTGEKIRLTWLCYATPILTGASTIAATVGVHTIHTKRAAALAGLYAVTSNKLDDYQEKAEELLGPKKTQQVKDEVAQKAITRADLNDHEVIILPGGSELCLDQHSERQFMGSINIVEQAVLKINEALLEEGGASLNDFYDHVGLPPNMLGADVGWKSDNGTTRVTAQFGGGITNDGKPCISFWLKPSPNPNFHR